MLNQPSIKSNLVSHNETQHTLTIEPLMPGYGYTLGNSIRRVLLSSVPGYAVTRVKINNITHEYQTLEGVVEDALDVILNLKNLRCSILTDDEEVSLSLTKSDSGAVTAADFAKNAKVKVINEDLYICTINDKIELNIEVIIEKGVGYLSVDQINFNNSNPQEIVVDALFSSVRNVALNVEKVRVGENTNFDKIIIDFETDNTVEAEEIVKFSMDTIIDIFEKIRSSFGASNSTVETIATAPTETSESKIEDVLDLPKTVLKILEKNEILTLSDLQNRQDEIEEFPGITEAHMKKISKLLND
jgi:DNA-directed RNA polymerase subunit alpha